MAPPLAVDSARSPTGAETITGPEDGAGGEPNASVTAIGACGDAKLPFLRRGASDGRYIGIYSFPPRFGPEVAFATLDEALAWANHVGGGVLLMVDDMQQETST